MGSKANKNTKTILTGFDYMHCDDFAKFLSDMAAKGWHFKEWGLGLKFEKGEPEKVTYAVEVFTKASENDLRPEPHTQEFAEYCEAAGWKFVDSKQKLCIFKRISEDALPLYTPEERVANSFKGMLSGTAFLMLGAYLFLAVMQWVNLFSRFEQRIFSNYLVPNMLICNILFLGQLIPLIYAFFQRNRLMKDVRLGRELYIGKQRDGKVHMDVKGIYIVLLVALMIYLFFSMKSLDTVIFNLFLVVCIFVFVAIMAKARPEVNTSVVIQTLFGFGLLAVLVIFPLISSITDEADAPTEKEELPLVFSDYRVFEEDIERQSIYHESNLFGSADIYLIFTEEDSLWYCLYESDIDIILDKIWQEEMDARFQENVVDCTANWEAQKAFLNKYGMYCVRYENKIFFISDNGDMFLGPDQIAIIREKMGLR